MPKLVTHPCGRDGCRALVTRNVHKFCSAECARLMQIKNEVPTLLDSITETGNSAEITKSVDRKIRTLADMVKVCEIDLDTWEIDRWVCNKWEVGAKDRNKQIRVTPLFQVKVWLKRKVAVIVARAEIDFLKDLAKRELGKIIKPFRSAERLHSTQNSLLIELAIPDLHAGKLAWAKETGYANYDTKIAIGNFEQAFETLMQRVPRSLAAKILLPIGNDLFNADNVNGMTVAGTPQDTDVRFYKTFYKVREMVVRCIERARLVAPVDVIIVPGNHDRGAVWHLGDSLECWFHTYKDVAINNHPLMRKYYQWGQVMLMFTHGDKGKPQDYPALMATEMPQMFGATTHREAHMGHIHRVQVEEKHGVKMRFSPALCPPDAWHATSQFVGNKRGAEAFVWDLSDGLIATAQFSLPDKDEL